MNHELSGTGLGIIGTYARQAIEKRMEEMKILSNTFEASPQPSDSMLKRIETIEGLTRLAIAGAPKEISKEDPIHIEKSGTWVFDHEQDALLFITPIANKGYGMIAFKQDVNESGKRKWKYNQAELAYINPSNKSVAYLIRGHLSQEKPIYSRHVGTKEQVVISEFGSKNEWLHTKNGVMVEQKIDFLDGVISNPINETLNIMADGVRLLQQTRTLSS